MIPHKNNFRQQECKEAEKSSADLFKAARTNLREKKFQIALDLTNTLIAGLEKNVPGDAEFLEAYDLEMHCNFGIAQLYFKNNSSDADGINSHLNAAKQAVDKAIALINEDCPGQVPNEDNLEKVKWLSQSLNDIEIFKRRVLTCWSQCTIEAKEELAKLIQKRNKAFGEINPPQKIRFYQTDAAKAHQQQRDQAVAGLQCWLRHITALPDGAEFSAHHPEPLDQRCYQDWIAYATSVLDNVARYLSSANPPSLGN